MNSRKVIKALKVQINYCVKNRMSPKFIEEQNILENWNNGFNIIEKDLETLDILKENIVECVGDSAGNEYLKLLFHKFCNEEKYQKLKEWLEDGSL